MHSRERLRTALNHQEPDRVPMMMSASPWVVERLKTQLNVQSDRELLKALNIDIFDIRGIDLKGAFGPKYIGPSELKIPSDWCGDLLPMFGYSEVITETPFGKAYSMGEPPLAAYETIETLESFLWPSMDWFDFSNLKKDIEVWADEFAIALTGPSVFQHATLFRGFSQILLEMSADVDLVNFIFDKITDFYYRYAQRVFEEAGAFFDILRLADDIGTEQGLLMSPKMIRQYFKEPIKKFADLAHQYNAKLLFHTDGNVRQIIPDLIEWGVDVLDSVQPEIPAMNHVELKREFGEQLSFSGGVSTQYVLPHQGEEAVKEEVKRVINELGCGGGYILSPGHPCLQSDVPTENIISMYQAGMTYGTY